MAYELEDIYDEQIAPLMAQIIAICKEHQMPMIASFAYRCEGDDDYDLCTTCLPGADDNAPLSYIDAIDAIYTRGSEIEPPLLIVRSA